MLVKKFMRENRRDPLDIKKVNLEEAINAINSKYSYSIEEKIELFLRLIARNGRLYRPSAYPYLKVWEKYIWNAKIENLGSDFQISILFGQIGDRYLAFRGSVNGKQLEIIDSLEDLLSY